MQRRARSASRAKLHQEAGRESEKSLGEADESATGSTFSAGAGRTPSADYAACTSKGLRRDTAPPARERAPGDRGRGSPAPVVTERQLVESYNGPPSTATLP